VAAGSVLLVWSFLSLCAVLAAGLVWATGAAAARLGQPRPARVRASAVTAVAVVLWLGFSGRLAASGFLRFEPTPTMLPLVGLAGALALALALSPPGGRLARGLPLVVLVGYQAFRIPVALILHAAHLEGTVPAGMTYLGLDFDVLTGLTALAIAALSRLGPVPAWLLGAWNLVGFGLLANQAALSILSLPGLDGSAVAPGHQWITHWPWVWLPAWLMPLALLGHLLVFRRLLAESTSR